MERDYERELAELEQAVVEEIDERDRAIEAADLLAYAIAPQSIIGEHSSMNNPWANALEQAEELHARADKVAERDAEIEALIRDWQKLFIKAVTRAETAEAALREYGFHKHNCTWGGGNWSTRGTCTCGHNAKLAEIFSTEEQFLKLDEAGKYLCPDCLRILSPAGNDLQCHYCERLWPRSFIEESP